MCNLKKNQDTFSRIERTEKEQITNKLMKDESSISEELNK